MLYDYGISLPQYEHVDIFPVRLVSTFHRVLSVYLTLAVYIFFLKVWWQDATLFVYFHIFCNIHTFIQSQ